MDKPVGPLIPVRTSKSPIQPLESARRIRYVATEPRFR